MEVDVLATVVEVVVHGDGSGSSGSHFVDVRGRRACRSCQLKGILGVLQFHIQGLHVVVLGDGVKLEISRAPGIVVLGERNP